MLGDAQQAKRVRTVGQAPRSLVKIKRPSSRCAPSNTEQGYGSMGGCFAPSRRAFGMRAPLAGDPVCGLSAFALVLRTIFAKQSLVSTLQGSGPAELGGF